MSDTKPKPAASVQGFKAYIKCPYCEFDNTIFVSYIQGQGYQTIKYCSGCSAKMSIKIKYTLEVEKPNN